jgi:hypothetical protein
MSSFLNKLLHKHVQPTSTIVLIILFWDKNTQPVLVEFPPKIIPYLIIDWK